jgi:hypothetical protein
MSSPEFVHFTRRGNRDIPTATQENLTALLQFYEFRITEKLPIKRLNYERCAISFDNSEYIIRSNAYAVIDYETQFLKNRQIKLHLQSLCGQWELPLRTIGFIELIDLRAFSVMFEWDDDMGEPLPDKPMIYGGLVAGASK